MSNTKVIVVDDGIAVCRIVRRMLSEEQYQVQTSQSVADALARGKVSRINHPGKSNAACAALIVFRIAPCVLVAGDGRWVRRRTLQFRAAQWSAMLVATTASTGSSSPNLAQEEP